ncbi:unnamed protein product [Bursaphelenchus okinawaensis]|uniref:RWD domain-containing protein n=1 Tax=Bursaphelenchus okinawaensis TaxID=465554 RepID=A0A811LUA8_9BILA|nr:unnamed protein product [Bursaphelenchus okinawaensis]CAG9128178.1 unnamed protein product [Bursaphelenchus okinawaensis]
MSTSIEDNLQQQNEEIFALTTVFPDVVNVDEATRTVYVKLDCEVELKFNLPASYPSDSPPEHHVIVPAFMTELQRKLIDQFRTDYNDFKGIPVICQCIVTAQNIVEDYKKNLEAKPQTNDNIEEERRESEGIRANNIGRSCISSRRYDWMSGECFEDRKSVFQAHIVNVHTKDEPMEALSQLLENSKIARATHNMYAYIIKLPNGIELSDCEDDGEKAAGPKLLHMLKLMNMENQMIVITRWYGGIHLGPDRFRHICNLARKILVQYREENGTKIGKKSKKNGK